MAQLPIQRLTLWKQGVGYFERRGQVSERELLLTVPRSATNDVLKSFNVVVHDGGQVYSVDYETPEDKQRVLADLAVKTFDRSSLVDLLSSLRGSPVRLSLGADQSASGRVIGVDTSIDGVQVVVIQQLEPEEQHIAMFPLSMLTGLELLDSRAATDVGFFLDVSRIEEKRTTLTVRLSEGEHNLSLNYLAPSPVWRMSYRLVRISDDQAVLSAWGIFENSLDEDLVDVSLTLMSGRPISFVYDLYESRVPKRPEVSDDTSTMEQLSGDPRVREAINVISHDLRTPISVLHSSAHLLRKTGSLTEQQEKFVRMIEDNAARMGQLLSDLLSFMSLRDDGSADRQQLSSGYRSGPLGDLKVSGQYFSPVMTNNAESEYMTYRVDNPVTVKRGQSAMVPIINAQVGYRSLIVFNGDKMPNHPLRVWELTNSTGYALEQGPVTVVDDGFAGEGLMRFAGVGDSIQIPYALEFGILVSEEIERSDPALFAVEFDAERRQAVLSRSQITTHTYTLLSRVQDDQVVLIERRDPTHDTYHEMPEAVFTGQGHTRWAVSVLGNQTATFPVRIRSVVQSREDAGQWKAEFVDELRTQGFISEQRFASFQALFEAKQAQADAASETQSLKSEHDQIQVLQDQIRKNLNALGVSEREAAIRDQLLTDLENSENRRRIIQARTVTLQQQVQTAVGSQQTLVEQIYMGE